MKNSIMRSAKYVTLLLILLLIGYSCVDDPVQQIEFEETQWKIVNVSVKEGDWTWDNAAGRYEAVVDLPELTKFIYESGAQLGYVFIGKQGVDEVQKMMPFIHTYYDENDLGESILYTETISCDFQYGTPSTAAFYIQASDLFRNDDILANYNFRLVLIW